MANIPRALLYASALVTAAIVASSAIPVAKAQISSEELFRRKHDADARRASQSFDRMWRERDANIKAQKEAERRAFKRWQGQKD